MSESTLDLVLNSIAYAAADSVPFNEDYVGDDGLLHCGKCHGRKEGFIPGLGRKFYLCECGERAYNAREQERKNAAEERRMRRLREQAFTSSSLLDCRFENDNGSNPEAMQKIRAYAEQWTDMKKQNKGLLLWGGVGSGKSFAAACIANELLDNGTKVRMRNLSTILNELFEAEIKNAVIRKYAECDLLIVDDFGMERQTDYATEQIFNLIDARYNSKLPMIVTTNLPVKEFYDATDIDRRRVYSRILEMCTPFKFNGQDQRRGIGLRKMEDFKRVIGIDR